jgi:hypothetical protein
MSKNHNEGFEKEQRFHDILSMARTECQYLKAGTVKNIIQEVCPEFLTGLSVARPCVRNLKYIGCSCDDESCSDDEFFKIGEIYESIDYTGATYSIKGYGEKRIGSAYFEWVD